VQSFAQRYICRFRLTYKCLEYSSAMNCLQIKLLTSYWFELEWTYYDSA